MLEWFDALSVRLARVSILCKRWNDLFSPTVMGLRNTLPDRNKLCGIFLDPPYATQLRSNVYTHDSKDVAHEVKEWAIENGDRPELRICVAGYIGDYGEWPEGWQCVQWGKKNTARMGGVVSRDYRRTEVLYFSPHCLPPEQGYLL